MLVLAELYPSWNKHSAESQPVGWVTSCSLAACRWRRQCRSQPNEVPSAGLTATQRCARKISDSWWTLLDIRTPTLPICGLCHQCHPQAVWLQGIDPLSRFQVPAVPLSSPPGLRQMQCSFRHRSLQVLTASRCSTRWCTDAPGWI